MTAVGAVVAISVCGIIGLLLTAFAAMAHATFRQARNAERRALREKRKTVRLLN